MQLRHCFNLYSDSVLKMSNFAGWNWKYFFLKRNTHCLSNWTAMSELIFWRILTIWNHSAAAPQCYETGSWFFSQCGFRCQAVQTFLCACYYALQCSQFLKTSTAICRRGIPNLFKKWMLHNPCNLKVAAQNSVSEKLEEWQLLFWLSQALKALLYIERKSIHNWW